MKLSLNSVKAIEGAIRQTAEKLSQHTSEALLTDLYVRVNTEDGKVEIRDDDGNDMASCQVKEWRGPEAWEKFQDSIVGTLRHIIGENRQCIDAMNVLRPFSFVLADTDGEVVDDIYLVDDENIMISGELMAGLDEELAEFLKKLMDE
ncbi:MAG: hypothetical protein MR517_00755 [Bacteroidales bacterium]|nr:hypothetical protein [Bacteroidales bacterium]